MESERVKLLTQNLIKMMGKEKMKKQLIHILDKNYFESNLNKYKVYTSSFDEIINATELCDSEELFRFRKTLDKQLESLQGVVSRLANKLQRKLQARQNRTWEFDLEEGMLDAAKLCKSCYTTFVSSFIQIRERNEFQRYYSYFIN